MFFFVLGIGAVIELSEFIGYSFLKFPQVYQEGAGILFPGSGSQSLYDDTLVDTLFNFAGSLLGVLFLMIRKRK
jgi:hypothetical protein